MQIIPIPIYILIQGLIFLFVVFFLRFIFFKPYMELLKKRFAETTGKKHKASSIVDEALKKKDEYFNTLSLARQKGWEALDEMKKEGLKIYEDIAKRADKTMIEERAKFKEFLGKEIISTEKEIEKDKVNLVKELMEALVR